MPSPIRALLEDHPELLAELFEDFYNRPPRILGPWQPLLAIPPNHKHPLSIIRRNVFHHAAIHVLPASRRGIRGPWTVEIGTTSTTVDQETIDAITDIERQLRDEDSPQRGHRQPATGTAFHDVLARIDDALEHLGYSLKPHSFPNVVFDTWRQSSSNRWTRPVKRPDPAMHPDFDVTIETIEQDVNAPGDKLIAGYEVTVFLEPHVVFTKTLKTASRLQTQQAADQILIDLGFNLARPTSFGNTQHSRG